MPKLKTGNFNIDYLDEGEGEGPVVLLVHSAASNNKQWRQLIEENRSQFRFLAINLFGYGETSAWPDGQIQSMSDQVALIEALSAIVKGPICLIGHSFGGLMTMRFAAHHGEQVGGVIIVDSPVLPESEKSSAAPRRALSVSRHYPTFEIGLERFRLLPKQECQNQFIVEFIARHSLRETVSGWTWKFDVAAMGSRRWAEPFEEHLHNMKCRSALIVADNSAIVSSVTAQYMSDLMGPESPMTTIEDSHHHIMLDQPFRFIDAVKKILRDWDLK